MDNEKDNEVENIKRILKKYKQEHILNGFENLPKNKQKILINQIKNIDFKLINKLYENVNKKEDTLNNKIEPIQYLDKYKLNEKYKYYENIGEKALKAGKLAVVTMAGGQGTRLGYNGPKGTFDIGLPSHKTLFELLCDYLKSVEIKYGVKVPWFIMTSKENNEDTVNFFKKNNYLGYQKDKNLFFFNQGELPMVDVEGKILIGEDGLIKEAADGHGGIYEALYKNQMIKKMYELGIEWVFIGAVDNCLVKMADPVLLGLAIDENADIASKSIVKSNPHEKVGVFCKKNGKPSVVEYTEITNEMAEAKDENGELLYGESHVLCNLFKLEVIEKLANDQLPYHSAFKKAKYIDETGKLQIPTEPNAYKFESFLFDAFNKVNKLSILRGKREEDFAPIKNSDDVGVDCPKTARKLYENFINSKKRKV